MKNTYARYACVVGTLLFPCSLPPVQALTGTVPENSEFYYEIGGASAVTLPANATVNTITLGGSVEWNIGMACGAFDPAASIGHTLNQIADGVERMTAQVINAAGAAIASLPALILQRANPGLYDLLQNGLDLGRFQFELATKNCKQMEAEIAAGKNPFDEWITLSKANGWRTAIGTGSRNIIATDTAIERAGGDDGLPWTGGRKAGGSAQPPIRVIGDVAVAGANLLMGREPHAAGPFAAGADAPRLATLWPSAGAARVWATEVLGDQVVTTNRTGARQSVPGHGLLPVVNRHQQSVGQSLNRLVTTTAPLTIAQLDTLAAPGTAITKAVIEGVRSLAPPERAVVMGKLAAEVALARTLEEALLMRRVLLTGKREPNVANAGVAVAEINATVAELEAEIENLLFESRVRREVVSHTVSAVLQEKTRRDAAGLQRAVGTPVDPSPVQDGGSVPR